MINKIIQEQLNKLQVAKLGEYDHFKHMYVIPKYKEPHYDVDHCYLVCLDDTLLTATGNEMLVSNWNNGRYPVHKYMKIVVQQKLGDMIKIDGIYFDNIKHEDINEVWSGWLPIKLVTIVKDL